MRGLIAIYLVVLANLAVWRAGAQAEARQGDQAKAQGEPGGVDLSWVRSEGADSCPGKASLLSEITRQLGQEPVAKGRARSLESVVTRHNTRWLVRIHVRDAHGSSIGKRELHSDAPDCGAVFAATVLALSLAIDPDAPLEPPPSSVLPAEEGTGATASSTMENQKASAAEADRSVVKNQEPSAGEPDIAEESSQPADLSPAAESRGSDVSITLRSLADAGVLPGLSAGIGINSSGRLAGRFDWSVSTAYFPSVRAGESKTELGFGLTSLSLELLYELFRVGRLRTLAMAGIMAGAIHVVVFDDIPADPGDYFMLGVRAGARLQLRVTGPLIAELGMVASVPLPRHRFFVQGKNVTVFRQSPVAGVGFIGLGVLFL